MKQLLLAISVILLSNTSHAFGATKSLKEIREEDIIMQQWDTSCAAAAMATILTYTFNDPVSEHQVATGLLQKTEPLKVRYRGGFSMLDMKKYATEIGYGASGFYDLNLSDIKYFNTPIIPLRIHGYNHYVVFNGLDTKGNIMIADPAYGNRTMSKNEFENAWIAGIAFVIKRRQ
ncbi:C39 family peptidase [Pseudemcibacter aquimaris]|uniref:C39 family peptidase n=1 Tax=Pseudemcibacter aquimaris TaxID=2857064 RepID=UPI0020133722|nr:cysteine peptidase family C39 domain-containing protein [Pseudemcibacter aquimaris]MCC3859979.1 hypothetical protein [Pseudemcibacter aquimaris]WDU57311.1 hypothetical protein KW060_08875 [Pseudemcibacter aquimaris]